MLILKTLRESSKISQDKLSKIIGVSRSTVAMWETNSSQPDIDTLIKLANFFNVSLDYLLERTTEPLPEKKEGMQMRAKDIRNELNISQADVAKHIGVSQQAYANYERGARQPDIDTLIKLANFFNVSLDYLLERTTEPLPEKTVNIASTAFSELSALISQLDEIDKAEIKGTVKQMLKADKYKALEKETTA